MITTAQRNKMRKVFKKGYSKDVQVLLHEKSVFNKKGLPFGESYINHVFNGRNTNLDIEEAIFELYQKRYNEEKKIRSRRKEILSTKKPDAGNIG